MAKKHTLFVCTECGYSSPRSMGKCPECGSWGSMVEEIEETKNTKTPWRVQKSIAPQKIDDIQTTNENRYMSNIDELDRVLGGGIVSGSVILLGGEPGIGKSTLMLQIADSLEDKTILYITGEESPAQIKMRAERLGTYNDKLYILSETNMEVIENNINKIDPDVIMIDSIQTLHIPDIVSAPGSVSQVRNCAAAIMGHTKGYDRTAFLIGHVTKDGAIAGPRVLEHMVDCVLYFEGDSHNTFRLLRSVKNRFGPAHEIGVFEMKSQGLTPVENPSEMLIGRQSYDNPVSGSSIFPSMEGSRCVLVETQALVAKSAFGNPRRVANGIDSNRLNMLLAVLEKKVKLPLFDQDVYINIAGGIKIDDPALDLAVVSAIVSGYIDRPIPNNMAIIGEIGLTGETRSVGQLDRRIEECIRLGFDKIILPAGSQTKKNIEILYAKTVQEAIKILFKH